MSEAIGVLKSVLESCKACCRRTHQKRSEMPPKAAAKIWAERIEDNEAWIASNPELAARKAAVSKRGWKTKGEKEPRAKRVTKRTRLAEVLEARKQRVMEVRELALERIEKEMDLENEKRMEQNKLTESRVSIKRRAAEGAEKEAREELNKWGDRVKTAQRTESRTQNRTRRGRGC